MGNTNLKLSATNQCSPSVVKPGMIESKQKRENKKYKKPWPHHLQWLWVKITLSRKQWISTQTNIKEDSEVFRNMKQVKSCTNPPDGGGEQKTLVNVEDASCIIIMGIPTKEWDDIPSPGLVFYHTSSHKFLHMDPNIDESQEVFSKKTHNANTMRVGDTILAAAAESGFYENWCLLYNQSTWNAFIYGKYMSNIIDNTGGKYLCVHWNSGITYTKNSGDLPGS